MWSKLSRTAAWMLGQSSRNFPGRYSSSSAFLCSRLLAWLPQEERSGIFLIEFFVLSLKKKNKPLAYVLTQCPYLYVLVVVDHLGVGEVEPTLDKEDCQEEEEENTPCHRQHVDEGLLHLQALQPPQVPDSRQMKGYTCLLDHVLSE